MRARQSQSVPAVAHTCQQPPTQPASQSSVRAHLCTAPWAPGSRQTAPPLWGTAASHSPRQPARVASIGTGEGAGGEQGCTAGQRRPQPGAARSRGPCLAPAATRPLPLHQLQPHTPSHDLLRCPHLGAAVLVGCHHDLRQKAGIVGPGVVISHQPGRMGRGRTRQLSGRPYAVLQAGLEPGSNVAGAGHAACQRCSLASTRPPTSIMHTQPPPT